MRPFTSPPWFLDPEPKLKTNSRHLSEGGRVSVSLDSEMWELTSCCGSVFRVYTLRLCAYVELESVCVGVLLNAVIVPPTGNR